MWLGVSQSDAEESVLAMTSVGINPASKANNLYSPAQTDSSLHSDVDLRSKEQFKNHMAHKTFFQDKWESGVSVACLEKMFNLL